MGYNVFQLGTLYLDNKIQPVLPKTVYEGDIPEYDGKATISIGSSKKGEGITWIKPDGFNLLIADRVLLVTVSWKDLDKNGFITGRRVLVDGQHFRCRLLQVGEREDVPNEWDEVLDETNTDNAFWHWSEMYFWGADVSAFSNFDTSFRSVRGYHSARNWNSHYATSRVAHVGFRPVLEPLPSDNPTPNINLEGINFRLASLPGSNTFCPILQPTREDVFKDIPVGSKVRMYTCLEDEKPIHVGGTVKDISKLTLTDRYYGDEFLVPWVVSNGVAVASQSLNQQL